MHFWLSFGAGDAAEHQGLIGRGGQVDVADLNGGQLAEDDGRRNRTWFCGGVAALLIGFANQRQQAGFFGEEPSGSAAGRSSRSCPFWAWAGRRVSRSACSTIPF
jgi:hypothetical protein